MHTVCTRVNAIFTFSLCVLATTTFLCFVSTSYFDYSAAVLPRVTLKAERASVSLLSDFTSDGEPSDLAFLTLNIQAVILWDKIIERDPHDKSKAIIDVKNQKPKYYFWDDGVGGLKGHQNVTLTMHWNVIPNSGPIFTSGLDLNSKGHQVSNAQQYLRYIRFPLGYATRRS